MTPFELDILLHYYASGADHPSMSNPPPIWRGEIEFLYLEKLLESGAPDTAHKLTERGRCFIDYITELPLPEWRMPRATDANPTAGHGTEVEAK